MDFGALPFDQQMARVRALAASREDPESLLREAAELADPEPFARVVVALFEAGRLDARCADVVEELVAELPDASLQHVLSELPASFVGARAIGITTRWGVERIAALALVDRWLRRHDREAHQAWRVHLLDPIETSSGRSSTDADPNVFARALVLADGRTLARLAREPSNAARVREIVTRAIDVLARAPKSISQANAERLLARRVYADPGHFFFELLQNADDAGATRFEAHIDPEAVTIRHDGAPFSLLDLVGVLSIGQTTKRAEQIGFFGVGFKSVYEVCERPRIRSGALAIEIAHVSIPRALALSRSVGGHARETTLELPLMGAGVAERVLTRALAVPPETLLTLGHVRALHILGGRSHVWRCELEDERATLRFGDAVARRFHVERGRLRFEGPREDGRARESELLVAAVFDERGVRSVADDETPATRPESPATLYAYLPTAERTGLRVLVHARFDVTLDRERLELDSAWNEALLTEAGRALARLVVRLGPEGLRIVSTRAELAPAMRPLADACARWLAEKPFLIGAAGDALRPSEAWLAEPDVARALAGISWGDRLALAPETCAIGSREAVVARELGVASFGPRELVAFVRERSSEGEAPPAWHPGVLDALARAPVDDEVLRALPLVVVEGRLVSADRVRLASASVVALYRGERALAEVHDLPEPLARRLAIARFEMRTLVEDLEAGARVYGRTAELFEVLEELEEGLLAELGNVVFVPVAGDRAGDGDRDRVRDGVSASVKDRDSAPRDGDVDAHVAARELAAPSALRRLPMELASFGPWLFGALPFVAPSFAERRVVRRLVRDFTRADLIAALEGGLALDETGYSALEAWLDGVASELPESLARRVEALPIFADRDGVRRPLVGAGRGLVTSELSQVVPDWPWLAREGAFVRARTIERAGAPMLARALAGDSNEPSVSGASIDAALTFVAGRARELPRGVMEALARVPIWSDARGTHRRLDQLRAGDTSPAIDVAFEALGARHVGSKDALVARQVLGFASGVDDRALLVGDVVAHESFVPEVRRVVVDALLECLDLGASLAPLVDAPIWMDAEGTARALASWSAPSVRGSHRVGAQRALLEGAGLPLLDRDEEARLTPLLDALGVHPPTVSQVLAIAARLANDPDVLLAFARRNADALDTGTRAGLADLPIVTSLAGTRRAARELVPASALAPLDARSFGLADVVAADDVIEALGLPHADVAELVRTRVMARLREGEGVPREWRLVGMTAAARATETKTKTETALRATDTDTVPVTDSDTDTNSVTDTARSVLVALASLASRLSLPFDAFAIALDASGHLARPPLFVASTPARALCDAIAADLGLADAPWVEALGPLAPRLVRPLPIRRLVEAMRSAPERVPDDLLFAWLRVDGDALADDAEARALFAQLPVFASQSGERRAPRELVLDPEVPDLGLGWGLASDVPLDVADFLRATFEIDRHARRAMVSQLLDGITEAARDDDPERARDLLAFLARALASIESEPLGERVRRLDVRARLLVPVLDSDNVRSWTKPRFAWSPADDVVAHASLFTDSLPPRVAWTDLDAPSRLVLAACGAKDDLDEATWITSLDRIDSLSLRARRALARYVLDRASLRKRRWIPSEDGTLRVPNELVVLDPLTHALLGDSTRFPDAEVSTAIDDATATRLGLRRASELTLDEIAETHVGREAPRVLLDFLDAGLEARRFSANDVRDHFSSIRLRDDEGILRLPRELLRSGGRALFGPRRGDWSASRELPRVARALGIPTTPNDAAIVLFLEDVGASLTHDPKPDDEATLVRVLPECLERLDDAALPEHGAVAVLRAGRVELSRFGDPSIRRIAPPVLAELLADDAPIAEPLPSAPSAKLDAKLAAVGVPDLFVDLRIARVLSGPRIADPRADSLARRVGRAVRVHDSIAIEGSFFGRQVQVEVDAALDGDMLVVTPAALDEPSRCAPALGPEPRARSEWIARLEETLERATSTPSTPPPRRVGLFDRVRRFFTGDESKTSSASRRSEPVSNRDAQLFRPRDAIESQLDRTEGWVDARREVPTVGLAFTPPRLIAPWIYAPQLVVTRFDRRGQRWVAGDVPRPSARGEAGRVVMRGRLPAGESVLPVPLYGELESTTEPDSTWRGASGVTIVRLREATELRLTIRLGEAPRWDDAREVSSVAAEAGALDSFVPDDELPDEALDLVDSLGEDDAPFERALAVRDFVRRRYRYDPSYLEDPAVGRHLARLTRGRAHAHVAALHAGADGRHLGAGVCYELNALTCELMRRAGIAAGLASGWVLDGGSVSEPDHLWALALLQDARGLPVWLPIDASSTQDGRPLLVPRRPPVRFRAPSDPSARAPKPPKDRRLELGRDGRRNEDDSEPRASRGEESRIRPLRASRGDAPREPSAKRARERAEHERAERQRRPEKKVRERRLPRAELYKVLHHLGRLTDRPLTDEERAELERALHDPNAAAALLERLRRR